MQSAPRILVFGNEPILLQTRRWVLEMGGYRVATTTQSSEVGSILLKEEIDLSILCHTLSFEQRAAMQRIAQTLRPAMRKLVLSVPGSMPPETDVDSVLSAFAGPEDLLAAVQGMMARSSAASPGEEWGTPYRA